MGRMPLSNSTSHPDIRSNFSLLKPNFLIWLSPPRYHLTIRVGCGLPRCPVIRIISRVIVNPMIKLLFSKIPMRMEKLISRLFLPRDCTYRLALNSHLKEFTFHRVPISCFLPTPMAMIKPIQRKSC